jgi:hypothetical protein
LPEHTGKIQMILYVEHVFADIFEVPAKHQIETHFLQGVKEF